MLPQRLKRYQSLVLALALAIALFFWETQYAKAVVTFDWATVGDVGNTADTRVMNKGPCTTIGAIGCEGDMTSGYGAVGYEYQIAKHHVTMSQYTEFLNSVDPLGNNTLGLYDDKMEEFIIPQIPFNPSLAFTGGIDFDGAAASGNKYSAQSGKENYPATYISWVSAARFVNWLSNGQGTGDTESGVYNMLPTSTNDSIPVRQAGATVFLPSEDEFYKAAYYDPTLNGGVGGYTEYGIGNAAPVAEGPAGGSTSANYSQTDGIDGPSGNTYWQTSGGLFTHNQNYLTDVGAYSSATSYYGLFDVDGNATQWTETAKANPFNANQELPISRGGSWLQSTDGSGASYRPAQFFATGSSSVSSNNLGLRIAQLVPTDPGDYDGDGDVDGADFLEWQRNDGTPSGLAAWQASYGNAPLVGAVTAVPEPSSVVLLLFTLVANGGLYRQRRCAA